MDQSERKFWPYKTSRCLLSAAGILVVLTAIFVVLRLRLNWPDKSSETVIFIGILLISLLPLAAALIDAIIERGGVLGFKDFKLDFSQATKIGMGEITIPTNIGIPSHAITDNDSAQILDTLRKAITCEAVIIDLEEGQAWWETRLLVLLAGATRTGKPGKLVFVGTDGAVRNRFQGWSHPDELFQRLLKSNLQYSLIYHRAMAVARQWELVEPAPGMPSPFPPPIPTWMQGLAASYQSMTRDPSTETPNEMLPEQILAVELGREIETQVQHKTISIARLEELFRPVLRKNSIDQCWETERQISEFFADDSSHIAITNKGKYVAIIEKLKILYAIVKTLVEKK